MIYLHRYINQPRDIADNFSFGKGPPGEQHEIGLTLLKELNKEMRCKVLMTLISGPYSSNIKGLDISILFGGFQTGLIIVGILQSSSDCDLNYNC